MSSRAHQGEVGERAYTLQEVLLKALGWQQITRQVWTLLKSAGYKYWKKVPTGRITQAGKVVFRYYYRKIPNARHKVAHNEFEAGAAFVAVKDGKERHYRIVAVEGDRITLEDDDSGERVETTKHTLAEKLHQTHLQDRQNSKHRVLSEHPSVQSVVKDPKRIESWFGYEARRARDFAQSKGSIKYMEREYPEEHMLVFQGNSKVNPARACVASCVAMVLYRLGRVAPQEDIVGTTMQNLGHDNGMDFDEAALVLSQHGVNFQLYPPIRSSLGPLHELLGRATKESPVIVGVIDYRNNDVGERERFGHAVVVEGIAVVNHQPVVALLEPGHGIAAYAPLYQFMARWEQANHEAIFIEG